MFKLWFFGCIGFMQPFRMGIRSMLAIIPGIIPFGVVMGSAFSEARLSLWQALEMNISVYAGASQLATIELMKLKTTIGVVLITGIIINLRFLLYSAAMAPHLKESSKLIKILCAFTLTDQSFAAMSANQDKFHHSHEVVSFYLGSATAMMIAWHSSVMAGFVFGNFAPAALALEFAIPLSFVALLTPTLKSRGHLQVVFVSSLLSLFFYHFPFGLGLILTAITSTGVAWIIVKRTKSYD